MTKTCEALTAKGICGRPTDARGYCGHERDHIEDEFQAQYHTKGSE